MVSIQFMLAFSACSIKIAENKSTTYNVKPKV